MSLPNWFTIVKFDHVISSNQQQGSCVVFSIRVPSHSVIQVRGTPEVADTSTKITKFAKSSLFLKAKLQAQHIKTSIILLCGVFVYEETTGKGKYLREWLEIECKQSERSSLSRASLPGLSELRKDYDRP